MAAEPLDYPSVTPSQLLLGRTLSNRLTELTVTVGNEPWHLSLSSVTPDNMPGLCLQLEVNHQPIALFMGSALLDRIMPENLCCQVLLELPEELMLAALGNKLQPLLQQLMQPLGSSLRFISLTPHRGGATTQPAELAITVQIAGVNYPLYLESNSIVLELLNLLPVQHAEPDTDTPFWVGLELGRAWVSQEEAKSLGIGDIVFFHHHVTGQQLIIRVDANTAFLGEANNSQITIKHRMEPMEDEFDEKGQLDLSNLEVELLFEVGRQMFTTQQLQQLQPGYIFELDRPIEQPVRIRVNGKVIAECQLVQINNRLGARVTQISS